MKLWIRTLTASMLTAQDVILIAKRALKKPMGWEKVDPEAPTVTVGGCWEPGQELPGF